MSILAKILFSKIRADLFRLLFGAINFDLPIREIEKRTGISIDTLRTELKKLVDSDLVIKRRNGNRVYFRANTGHPLYPDIRNIVLKTIKLADVVKKRKMR